jgi:hypothetical protein
VTGQRPSLGRIVLVPMNPAMNNGATEAPAIVTRVWSDTSVNVRVLADSAELEWRTSVKLVDELPEYEADDSPPNMHVWCWPPRV